MIYNGKEYPVKSVAELIVPSTAETLAYLPICQAAKL